MSKEKQDRDGDFGFKLFYACRNAGFTINDFINNL